MDTGSALDRLRTGLGSDLRVFADVRDDGVEVRYVRGDIDTMLEGVTHEAHLRDIASAMLPPGGTASVRYTPDTIVVGMPKPTDDESGYLISLEHAANEDVDEFIDTVLDQGATIMTSTTSGPGAFSNNGNSQQLND